jgi:hypothetical protein
MNRTTSDLQAAAARAGAVLVSTRAVVLRDGSTVIAGRFAFSDPWAAARLLDILAEQDAGDPMVAAWAREILFATADQLGEPLDSPEVRDAFAQALHANVQQQIRFEPEIGEQFQSARATMIEGVGDCDCHARLVHALARSQGLGSCLRYFEHDGEPTHVVAALETSGGPAWAETTIGALFGEHPQKAYRRLGLEATGDRPDIAGLGSMSGDDVRALQEAVKAQTTNISAAVLACAPKLDAATLADWYNQAARAIAFVSADVPTFFGLDAMYQQGRVIFDALETTWPERLAAAGCGPVVQLKQVPAPAPPAGPGLLEQIRAALEPLGTVAIVAGVALAVGVGVVVARRI